MASTTILGQAKFNYTTGGVSLPVESGTVTSYAAGSVHSALAKKVGTTDTPPVAYPLNTDIPLAYTFTPATQMGYTGLSGSLVISDVNFDGFILTITGTGVVGEEAKVTVKIGDSSEPFKVEYVLDTTAKTLSIPVTGTDLASYTPSDGNILIGFNVKATAAHDAAVLGYQSTMAYTTIEGETTSGETLTSTVTGAAPIANIAVSVALSSPQGGKYIYDAGEISYTVIIAHVTDAGEATIAAGAEILVPDANVALNTLEGKDKDNFLITGGKLVVGAVDITVNATTGASFTVTAKGTYTKK